jgi:recombination protein RecA
MSDERIESLKAAIGQIERQFGKGAVMRMGDDGPREKIEVYFNWFSDIGPSI